MSEITLSEWNRRQPRPRSIEQVRRWVRSGRIQPPPRLDGREYLVQEDAVKINFTSHHRAFSSRRNLTERIKNGRKETKS